MQRPDSVNSMLAPMVIYTKFPCPYGVVYMSSIVFHDAKVQISIYV